MCVGHSGWAVLASAGFAVKPGGSWLVVDLGWPQLGCLEQLSSAPHVLPYILQQAIQASSHSSHWGAREWAKLYKHLFRLPLEEVTFANMPLSKASHRLSPESRDGLEQPTQRELQRYKTKGMGTGRGVGWGPSMQPVYCIPWMPVCLHCLSQGNPLG